MTCNIRLILTVVLAIILSMAPGKAKSQTFFSEDWSGAGESLPSGWTTTLCDKTPDGQAAEWFSRGDGWKVIDDESTSGFFAASYSATVEGGKVDTWLISPEFEVPAAGGFVEIPLWTIGDANTPACKMSVRMTDAGSAPESFTGSPLLSTRIKHSDGVKKQMISLSAYAGKKVRMAIVNEGTNAGILCAGKIEGNVCKVKVSNRTPLLISSGTNAVIKLGIDIQAFCPGFDVTVTTSDGFSQTKNYNKQINGTMQGYEVSFPSGRPSGNILSYTATVRPHIDGITPTETAGSLAVGEGYPQICLMEEATGENCGYCPAGSASIERFGDMYPGRFIGVGVHCSEFSTKVMENPEYADPYLAAFNIVSFPSAVLNRESIANPVDFAGIDEAVKSIMDASSIGTIAIDRVDCDKATGETTVSFSASLCAPLTNAVLNACVILSADGLTGNSRRWFQSDYYSGMSEEDFLKNADASWWPYMKFWCEYPSDKVSPTDRSFDHVGMGVYPDFSGEKCQLGADWSDGKAKRGSITFSMPMQQEYDKFGVQDVDKTAVTAVLLNAGDGTVVAAQQVKAGDYNRDLSAVSEIESDSDFRIWVDGDIMMLKSDEDVVVEVYTADGRKMYSACAANGISSHYIGNLHGVLIVTVGDHSMKLLN